MMEKNLDDTLTSNDPAKAAGGYGMPFSKISWAGFFKHARATKILTAILALLGYGIWDLFFAYHGPDSFPIRITVELEYQGKPVTISRVNECVSFFQGHGIGGGGGYFWGSKFSGMGAVLPDGSAVFMGTPNACPYIGADEKKSGEIKYGEAAIQPAPTFVPSIAWAPDAKHIDGFEQYFLKEAVTEPGSRIIYKGTKVERLKSYSGSIKDDGFSWYTGVNELIEHHYYETSSFFAFFLVPISNEELNDYPEVRLYIKTHASSSDGFILPEEVGYKLKKLMYEIQEKNYFFTAPVNLGGGRDALMHGGGGVSPSVGMLRDGDYGGHTIRDKGKLQEIDRIIPLQVEGGRLIAGKFGGTLFRIISHEEYIGNAKIDYAIEGIKNDRIRLWDAVIVQNSKPYFFMMHTMDTCTPSVTCKMKTR
ncbi:MAG: hypothetical protein EPN26_11050 [Rhodospirillales bacterium]|nr:MAG: hypothetical protein EPN26_11050 [Rhodospirillales bacterium]